MKKLEIFKAGKHTAMSGKTVAFGEAELEAAAAAYDPAKHEAPLVVGHPRSDAPAYGWVKRLGAEGQALFAEPHQVDAAFAELVAAGRFKKLSACFYEPDSPTNPVPGAYYLRHVGFLGAQPPAVKGLRDAAFADGEEGLVEFGDWEDQQNAGLWRSLRDWLIGKFGLDEAEKVVPAYAVGALEQDAAQDKPEPEEMSTMAMYTEAELTQKIQAAVAAALADKGAAFSEKETALKAREAKIAEAEKAARHSEVVAFVEGLKAQGKVTPALEKLGLVAFLEGLGTDEALSFGEGDDATKSQLACAKKLFAALPKAVEFGEVAARGSDLPAGSGAGTKLDALVQAKCKAEPALSYAEAFSAAQAENPDLAAEYLQELRG